MEKRRRNKIVQYTAIVFSLIMAVTLFPMNASAETGDGDDSSLAVDETLLPDYAPGQLIVVTKQSTSKTQMKSIAKRAAGRVDSISTMNDGSKVALVDVEEGDELTAAAAFECEDEVLFAQPNYIYELEDEYPNDTYYLGGNQNYLAPPLADGSNAGTVNAKGAWDQLAQLETTGKTLVAIIDSGVRYAHEDLIGQVIVDKCTTFNEGEQMGFTDNDGSTDDVGHGTKVAGNIAATLNNEKGIAGTAGAWVDLFAVDVQMPDQTAYAIDIFKGIEYAADEGARLINISLGSLGRDYLCERALKYAWDKGALCICSAGNKNTSYIHFLSDCPYAVAVMGHQLNGTPADFSNYGIEKDISAPGNELTVLGNSDNASYMPGGTPGSGTSFASPIVVGAAALLLAADPDLTNRELKNLLYTSTGKEDFSPEKEGQGFGRINVDTAMQNLLAEKTDSAEKIVINRPSLNMYEGMESSFEYAVYPGNTDLSDLQISTSNKNVAEVYDDGVIAAKAPGIATIEVDCGGVSAKFNVTVENPYRPIDQKPYAVDDILTTDGAMDFIDEVNESGLITDGRGVYCQQYHIKLEENETIRAIMTIQRNTAGLRIKDRKGRVLKYDSEDFPSKPYAMVEYTAEQTGIYIIQTMWRIPSGQSHETNYTFRLLSDKSFCEPAVDSITDGEMHMSWPAVEHAGFYRVRKYTDSSMSEIEFEEVVTESEFTDTTYDESKANYYTVTSGLTARPGDFFNGETPFAVKLENPMTAEAKTVSVKASKLKKGSVKVEREKYLTVENAQGDLTYKKDRGNKKITVSKTGKLTIKKGLKKGNYNVTVSVTASGNDEYDSITQAVKFKVRVK